MLNPTYPRLSLTALAALVLSAGCSTLSESQCVASDWQTVGYADGLKGAQSSQLLQHQNACVKYGIIPEREAYLAGWEQGARRYCLPENGFSVGERGAQFSNVCPDELHPSFYAAYQEGRQLYMVRSEIDVLSRQISQKKYRLKQIAARLSSTEARLVETITTPLVRRELLNETKELALEIGQLEAEIQDLKVAVALKSERLYDLRQTLAYAF